MSGLDRFTAFLRRAAPSYNEPPEVPAEAMWRGVEEGVADRAAPRAGTTGQPADAGAPADDGGAHDVPIHAPGYHTPPAPPRDAMWKRIEASWALRQAAAPISAHAEAPPRRRPVWTARRARTGWAAALAAAASLVLGIALGRGTRTPQPGEMTVPTPAPPPAALAPETVTPTVAAAQPAPEQTGDPGLSAAEAPSDEAVAVAASVTIPEAGTEAPNLVAVNAPAESAVAVGHEALHTGRHAQPRRYEPEQDYLTARHLGRAATLLTAFRTDRRTPASEQDLAQWAGELLVDTRMFLGLSDFGSPIEQMLLEDLELVLIQIAGLGPGVPDFEWALARESMERRGTLARLRAVSVEGEI